MLSRKSNSVRVEAGSRQGQQRTWCVPAGTGRPQGRCVPTDLSFRGDCRQWVAPAFGSGILSDRANFVAEKQRRRRRGLFKPGTAANVVCPRWDRAPPRQVCPQGLTLGPGLGWTGVSPRLGPSKVTAGNGWPQRLALVFGVIGQVVSRKSNVARVEAGSRQGQRRGPSQLLLSNSCCGWYRCQRLDL